MFQNKKIFVLGLSKDNYQTAKCLVNRSNEVVIYDWKNEADFDQEQIKELRNLGVTLIFGEHSDVVLDNTFDYLVKSPVVPNNHEYVLKAKELEIEVINELELSYRLLPEGVKVVAITGTNGKTTTTRLTYEIMRKSFGDKVYLVEYNNSSLCSILNNLKSGDIVIIDVSYYQLENLIQFKPDVALITNLCLAHMDFFKDYVSYKHIKAKLVSNQTYSDTAILNIEDDEVLEETKNVKSKVKYFSSKKEINGGYLKDNDIYYYGEKVMSCDNILLMGMHNIDNCISAIMLAKEFDVSNEIINEVMSKFNGIEHCLEYVDTVEGRRFYNDTSATNIKRTQVALDCFYDPTIIILGGMECGQDFNSLTPFMGNVKTIIGIGQCRDRILEYGKGLNIPTYSFESLSDGFDKGFTESSDGDIILLSPASVAENQYGSYKLWGVEFKKKVEEVKNECNQRTKISSF